MKPDSASKTSEKQSTHHIDAGLLVFLAIVAAEFAIHLFASRNYGYFRDELYYIACGDHLDWGYVDQPPLVAFIVKIERWLLGDSLTAIRLCSILAGTAKVLLTGFIAGELGGQRSAQILAALAVLVAPGFLAVDSFFSMNPTEALLWTACVFVLIRIIKTGNQRLWLWFGLLADIGLENKHSMLIWGAAIVAGLLLTPHRRVFLSPWIWAAGLLAGLIFLPNLIWNYQHHFPFLELQENIRRSGRNAPLTPIAFFSQEVLSMNPVSLPMWLAGLWFYFFSKTGRPFRPVGWAWVFAAVIILKLDPRVYYLFPAYPVLFAGGSVLCESWFNRFRMEWGTAAYASVMLIVGVLLAPLAVPVLPVETYIQYSRALHLQPPAIERSRLGPLPQVYADQFGWAEMVATVAGAYNALPADVRAKTAIFAQNYGEAGAIDFFGAKYGLPKAISGHQNYFLWGPRQYTGESVIVLQDIQQTLEEKFAEVRKVATVYHPYSMPYEHYDVFYCGNLKQPLPDMWPELKKWE